MSNESARAYIALAIEVEEVRKEVARAQQRVELNPRDDEALADLQQGREMLERLDHASGVFMKLLKERDSFGVRSLYDSADLA